MLLSPSGSVLTGSRNSVFQSVQSTPPAQSSSGFTLPIPGHLHVAANKRENVALARQLANHKRYICYQLPRYHRCGHLVGRRGEIKDLLLSQQHIDRLGYGTACDGKCAVDHSRCTVAVDRCPMCVSVEECFSVVLKHSCGHLAGVLSSAGSTHSTRLGFHTPCDARCYPVQIDHDVGGACTICSGRHCCMIFGSYGCGHRASVVGQRVIGSNHLLNLGSSLSPCDTRCCFEHQKREIGKTCLRCKPMYVVPRQRRTCSRW